MAKTFVDGAKIHVRDELIGLGSIDFVAARAVAEDINSVGSFGQWRWFDF